jgi:hypothetical protein
MSIKRRLLQLENVTVVKKFKPIMINIQGSRDKKPFLQLIITENGSEYHSLE